MTWLCLILALAAQDAPPSTQPATQSASGAAASTQPAPVPPQDRRPIELSPNDAAALEAAGLFVQGYYRNPEPDRIPELVRTMARTGFLSARGGEVGPAAGFLRVVFAANGERLGQWVQVWRDLPAPERQTLATILWAADTDEARRALATMRQDAPAGDPVGPHVDSLKDKRPTPLLELELSSPDVLDALWGAWFASGDPRYVVRLTQALPLLDSLDPNDRSRQPAPEQVERFSVGAAARWSLTSNAIQDQRVFEALRAAIGEAPPDVKPRLQSILDTAATERRLREQR